MTWAIGIDIGGTKIALAAVDDGGCLTLARTFPTPATGPAILALLARETAALMDDAVASGRDRPAGIGVGTGGVVDQGVGVILHASDLIGRWAGTPVAEVLSAATNTQVRVDNDGNAFALGEWRFGAGRATREALYVAVGTGIGGGLVLDGRLRRGPRHLTGEFGHLPFPTARRCSCGLTGHVEAVAAGPAMAAAYSEAAGHEVTDLRDVAERVALGEKLACQVVDAGASALATALAGVLVAVDVRVVVIGGGVACGLGERYRATVANALTSALPHGLTVDVRTAELGPGAAVAGAAALVLIPPERA
jgi:glucokinase